MHIAATNRKNAKVHVDGSFVHTEIHTQANTKIIKGNMKIIKRLCFHQRLYFMPTEIHTQVRNIKIIKDYFCIKDYASYLLRYIQGYET
jgi:hypothetical protein